MPHAISFLSLVQGIMGEIYNLKKKKKKTCLKGVMFEAYGSMSIIVL